VKNEPSLVDGRPQVLPSGHEVLLGRDRECLALDRLVDAVRLRQSGALVVLGTPGVGKTRLLDYVRARATGCRVAQVAAMQSEMAVELAALHQLCGPFFDRLERLPGPQRATLEVAFGLTEGIPPDRLFLGLAVVTLLSEAAESQPLVCLVDDAQWLDGASSQVLGFVARRLPPGSVALVIAAREQRADFAGLPELCVGGLSNRDARTLLMSALRGPLDERVRERILAETGGNPRALLELPRKVPRAQLAGGFGRPDAVAVTSRAEPNFTQRLESLPDDSRRLLLLAAAEPLGEPLLLWRAAEELGVPSSAVEAAEAAGVLEIGTRVRFPTPLARSVVYRSAQPGERRTVHGALAEATDARSDPERRIWHRAHATSAPDEDIAAELERSAARAATRGGVTAAAAFFAHAAALTPDPVARGHRVLTAAEAERQAGEPNAALRAAVTAEARPLDVFGRARAELLRARVAFSAGAHDAPALLFLAARRLEPLDIDLARASYLDALGATVYLGPQEGCDPVELAHAALGAHRRGLPRPIDLLLDGLALQLTKGYSAAAPALRLALTAFASDDTSADMAIGWGWLASHVAAALWEHDLQCALAERHVRLIREAGALAALPHASAQLVGIHMRQGELAEAAALMLEADATLEATPSAPSVHAAMLMTAYQGREGEARSLIEAAETHSRAPRERGLGVVISSLAGLVLNNGLGHYDDALRHGRRALDDPEPVARPAWALPELVEAAARAGAMGIAAGSLRQLSERASISGTDWALGLEARSRALLSDGSEADGLYREAIARLARPGSRVDLARAHLLYGEWLRRAGRRIDAREHLRTAHEMLGDMGVEAFAERARRELRTTGETVRKRTVETRDELTAQEHQIARLVSDGLSNAEIGERLFISPRTVEWHLRKIFLKLGISSRRALRGAVLEPPHAVTAVGGLPTSLVTGRIAPRTLEQECA
jgi:DNA-binding CsgD family transcriptional regulator